ncbi:hypothetical protein [Pedobacter sp. KLB.chiD]|uniref:hypothetical protein n=1 Tax=Pedobacter sp. KLB.chiD TaxID=3387402 RepID=UPI00399A6112
MSCFSGKQLQYSRGEYLPALPPAMKNGIRSIRFSLVIFLMIGQSPCSRPMFIALIAAASPDPSSGIKRRAGITLKNANDPALQIMKNASARKDFLLDKAERCSFLQYTV